MRTCELLHYAFSVDGKQQGAPATVPQQDPSVVLGGQEFSDALQQTLEAIQFGKLSAADAATNAQADSTAILAKAAQ